VQGSQTTSCRSVGGRSEKREKECFGESSAEQRNFAEGIGHVCANCELKGEMKKRGVSWSSFCVFSRSLTF
jgi:hypothetical protein